MSQPSYTARVAAASLGGTGCATSVSGSGKVGASSGRQASCSVRSARRTTAAGAATALPHSSSQAPAAVAGGNLTGSPVSGAQPHSPCWPKVQQVLLMPSTQQLHSSPGSRPPSQPPPTTRAPSQPPAASRALSQPPSLSHSPRMEVSLPLSQASLRDSSLCAVAPFPAVTAVAPAAPSRPAMSGSVEAVGVNRLWMHRSTLERQPSEQHEDRLDDRNGHPNRHRDLFAEIASLRQGFETQRNQLTTAIAEQLQASGFGIALEALRADLKDLRKQQDLQAGALRDGLMEIHQQRAELLEIKSLSRGEGRGSPASAGMQMPMIAARDGDGCADSLAERMDELRTCIAELHARLEREMTEVLRKAGRQREEFCIALDEERAARGKQVQDLIATVSLGTTTPSSSGKCTVEGGGSPGMQLGFAAKLERALEAERRTRAKESTELRAMLARLASKLGMQRGGGERGQQMKEQEKKEEHEQEQEEEEGCEGQPAFSARSVEFDGRCSTGGCEPDYIDDAAFATA
eukprot:CAMPEP_0115247126 /NCGR_PEP_ID=MMETSP0270-20121206/41385_1 /TAXON_ID=71861 /ORGANISM="Scrippsiella trochoidea, Strain CCMP3099" /LENGTH=518 /DNA_ID=CAMNT_0002662369 /DNA_START=60 /DNA_END=1613 /DNA_ORIENTATION=+